jgi:hypothetical protein
MSGMDDGTRQDGVRGTFDRASSTPPKPRPWNVSSAWNIPDVAPDEAADPGLPLAALVSFHYLRAAVRRRWLRCAVFALLGLLVATAFLAATPALPTAHVTLLLTHEQDADPNAASATDISLLTTQTVAENTIKELGLSLTPEALLNSVTPVQGGSAEVVELRMTGPTEAEATRRLGAFTRQYLAFRAAKVTARTQVLINGYKHQIDQLNVDLTATNKRIEALSSGGQAQTDSMTQELANKQKITGQIGDLEQTLQQTQLQLNSVVKASGVIDPAVPVVAGHLRHNLLVLASGLIGGLFLGLVIVILQAIVSDRLWLRIEVATALDAPAPLSVRRIAPPGPLTRMFGFLPRVRRRLARRAADRQRLGDAIDGLVDRPGHRASLAVLCLDNADEMRFGVLAAAMAAGHRGRSPLVVDLTGNGVVDGVFARMGDVPPEEQPEVFRPTVVPSLSRGPADLVAAEWDDVTLAKVRAGVILVVADLDPAVGVDHLRAWTDDVLVAVTAGRSSVELVRTAGDLVRSVGLHLHGAVVLRAVRDDMSSGLTTGGANEQGNAVKAAHPDQGAERFLLP